MRNAIRAIRGVGVVAFRDARRLARRPSTALVRTAVSFVGIAMVLTAWQALPPGLEEADFAILGRELFESWRALVYLASGVLAPLAVALGIQEERDGGTLEMLALSDLSPRSLFVGVAFARTAMLGLIVLGSVPVLSVALGLGGFGIDEVLLTAVQALVGLVVLSVVSGVFALTSRHPLLPAVATWAWTFLTFGPISIATAVYLDLRPNHASMVNPVLGVFEGFQGLPGIALLGCMAIPIGALGGPVLDIALSQDEDDEFGALSPSRWALERVRRMAWLAFLVAAFFTFLTWPMAVKQWMPSVLWFLSWSVLLATVQTSAAFVLLLWGIDRLHGLGRRNETRRAEALRRSLMDTRVGDDPILWRDRQFAGPTTRFATGLLLLGLALFTAVLLMEGVDDAHDVVPTAALTAAVLVGVLAGVGGAVEEARSRTWVLLSTTPITRLRLVTSKLAAVLWATAPLFLTGMALWGLLRAQHTPHSSWSICSPQLTDTGDIARMAWTGLWTLLHPLWLTSLALWLGHRAGIRWVWPGVALAITLMVGIPAQFGYRLGWIGTLILPMQAGTTWDCGVRGLPLMLVASTALYGLWTLGWMLAAARSLER